MASIPDRFEVGPISSRPALPPAKGAGSNLFIAARPDMAAAAAAQAVAREMRDKYRMRGQPLSMSRLHVSLVRFGMHDVLPESLVHHAREALAGLVFEPFEIAFDRVSGFQGIAGCPVVLHADRQDARLKDTVERLADRIDGLGTGYDWTPDVTAHMTLIHHTSRVMPEPLETPIRWRVDGLWLIDSLLGYGTHTFLWPQQDGRDAA